jgi:hypothetical protein
MPDIGGIFSAEESEDAAFEAADRAEREGNIAWSRQLPWNVEGPFGSTKFTYATNPETGEMEKRLVGMELSPELKKEYDLSLESRQGQREAIAGYQGDPDKAAQAYYDRYKQIVAPEQESQVLGLENRLVGQGMLGSTGGAGQMQALRQAQYATDLNARMESDTQVQGMIDTYRARGAQDLASAVSLGNLPASYAAIGTGQGQALSAGAMGVAGIMTNAANTRAQAKINTAQAYGKAINQGVGMVTGGISGYMTGGATGAFAGALGGMG